MQTLIFGLSVTLLGMVVVFVGLIILIVCVKGISLLSRTGEKKQKPVSIDAPALAAPAPTAEGISPDVIAAITAAVAAVWQGEQGFVVRHIKRVSNAPAWNRAGREEQTYSRY